MWEISNWIQAKSTGRVALAALALFVAFASTVLPAQSSAAAAASQGVGSPDLSLVYSPAVLYHMAERYGPDGRTAYIRARASFDVIWPAVYLVFLTTAISWLYGKAASDRHRWQLGNLLPVGAVALDLMENLSTSIVMIRFPAPSPLAASLAPLFTFMKWGLVSASMVLLVVWMVAATWRLFRSRRTMA
jgi:hypothetical protein